MDFQAGGRLQFGFQNAQPPATGGEFLIADFATMQGLVLALERNGFHSFWAGDHLAFAQPIMDPLIQISQASAISQRLMLGTAVLLLPLRHPAGVAKQVATLDRLSSGRVIFGVGVVSERFAVRVKVDSEGVAQPCGKHLHRSAIRIDP